jgi:hypothetical protein
MWRLDIGMTAVSLHDPSNGMLSVWGMLAGEWAVMMVLAWYLEQVWGRGGGLEWACGLNWCTWGGGAGCRQATVARVV